MNPTFKISNLTCEACVKLSIMALKKISGVRNVRVDLSTGLTQIESDREIPWSEIQGVLLEIGKQASKV